MPENKVRYLFFDIDGTIAVNSQPPSEMTQKALKALQRNGHKIFICTARTMCDVYQSLLDIGFDGIVAGAGAHIEADGKVIYQHYIPEDILQKTVQGMYDHNFSGVLEATDNIYFVEGEVPLHGNWPFLQGMHQVNSNLKVEKFTIHTFDSAHVQRVVDTMPALLDWYDMYENNDASFGEFVFKGVNKAIGIDRVMEYYGAPLEDSIAFGDSRNDTIALVHVGFGVAMGNAPLELREQVHYVTGTLAEEGVARALVHMGLVDEADIL